MTVASTLKLEGLKKLPSGKKDKLKFFLKYISLSLGIIIVIPIVAYFANQRWFMFVGVPGFLLFVWIIAIANLKSDVDEKAEEGAYKMLRKKEEKITDIKPTWPIKPEGLKEEFTVKATNPYLQEELEVPRPPKPAVSDVLADKMREYKEQGTLIQEAIDNLIEQQQALKEQYEFKVEGITNKINTLTSQRKQLKEKLLESIDL